MSHATYTDLRANLARYMDDVCDSRAPLLVTRQNARSVVMMAEDEYESLIETLHLVRSPANAERLLRSVADAESGRLEAHDLVEPDAGAP